MRFSRLAFFCVSAAGILGAAEAPSTPPETASLENEPGETAALADDARPDANEIPVIEVRAKRNSQERPPSGARSIEGVDVSALPNPADDVFQMVRHLPGVSTGDVGSAFHVRGGSVDETLVRIDGLEVRNLFHGPDFGGVTGIIPLSVVDAVNVYTGGFPASYGGRLSGVIDASLRSDGERGFHGMAGVDGVAARVLAEYHSDPASMLVSVREGYLDRVLGVVQKEAVIQPGYRDLLWRSVWRPSTSNRIAVNYLRSEDHVRYEDGIERHFIDTDYLDHHLWGTGQSLLWHRLVVRGMGYRSWSRQLRVVDLYGKDHQTNDRVGGRLELSFATPGRHLFTVGGQVDREWGWYDLVSREVVSASEEGGIVTNPLYQGSGSVDRTRLAVFAQDEWSPFDRLGLNLGVRASRGPFTYGARLDPRLSAALQLGGEVMLRGAWGVYEQDPVIELDGTGTHEITGGRTAQSRHMTLGVEKRFGGVRLGVDAYDKELWKLDGLVTRTVEGEIERQPITRGRARGVEVFLQRSSAASNWWVAYSLGRSAWGNQRRTYVRDFDRLHTLSVTNTFQIASDWDLGMSWSVHTGTPYTKQRWERDAQTGAWALSEGVPNAARLPLYQRLDVRVRRHFRFDRWQVSVYAEGLNLTNHDNVIWYSWGFREVDGSRAPYQIARTGLPSIPCIGLEIKF